MWKECKALQDELVGIRHDLHRIPELGISLPKTQAYIAAKLDEYGISYEKSPNDSSIIATIKGGKPGKTIALRADMDALPIQEETGVDYASEHDGCMHACGHDTHVTMLLGAAKVLKAHASELSGTVRLLFQTGEEISKGAAIMVKNGAVDGVDGVFGIHIGTVFGKDVPSGTIVAFPGPNLASFDRFVITVKGLGCHGSTPEKGIDPVNIAAHIVLGLEAIQAREFNACVPNVVTIGKIAGGSQYNIIPDDVVIEGTTRCFSVEVRNRLAKRIEEISRSMAEAFGAKIEFMMDWGAPPLNNVPEMAEIAAAAAKDVVGEDKVITHMDHPNMGGEDFAEFLQKVPGAFMCLSSANPNKEGTCNAHHNSKFNVDEDVFWIGSAVFVSLVNRFLA